LLFQMSLPRALFSSSTFHPTSGEDAARLLKAEVRRKETGKFLFIQAVDEVIDDLIPVFNDDLTYAHVMRIILEPERVISFRVTWTNDKGQICVNRGYRVQYSSALGPYEGGLRFWSDVTLDTVQFLGFEQTFKNSLTTLGLGGAKGGADFDPSGKSDGEVMRFCQSFMCELYNHIGATRDVPTGDIGVGNREIGFLFGMYKKLQRSFEGSLTGKGVLWGGSYIRPEATGYGCVYFALEALKTRGEDLVGKRCVISGSGIVAQYTIEKLLQLGAIPLTVSDRTGYLYEPNGFSKDQINEIARIKTIRGSSLEEYLQSSSTAQFYPGRKPWDQSADYAFPSATQNEITGQDAEFLVQNGCKGVFECANMPCTQDAIRIFMDRNILFAPSKACSAGGVVVSGLEMTQNAQMEQWTSQQTDEKLHEIMKSIHLQIYDACTRYHLEQNLKAGANIAAFLRLSNAVIQQGGV